MSPTLKRLGVVAPAAVVLIGLGWLAASAEVTTGAAPIPRGEESAPSTSPRESAPSASEMPGAGAGQESRPSVVDNDIAGVVIAVLLALCGLAIVCVLTMVAVRAMRGRSGWARLESRGSTLVPAEEVRSAVQAGLSDIDAGQDSRAAVIACWLRLERVAAAAGVARGESQTPSELVAQVLAAHQVDNAALDALRSAYHQARYAPDLVDIELRDEARAALAEVDAQLGQEVAFAEG